MLDEEKLKNKYHDVRVLRAYFLILMGSMGAAIPFLNLFMTRQNLNGTQIGTIISVGSVVGLFSAAFWVNRQSESKRPILMLQFSLIMSGLMTLFFVSQRTFLLLGFFYAARILFNAGHFSVADMLAIHVIKGTQVGYGSIRFWGSLGWVIVVLITGWVNERFSLQVGISLYAVLNLVAALILFQLKSKTEMVSDGQHTTMKQYWASFRNIFRNPLLSAIGVMVILTGITNLGVLSFETLYLDILGASDGLIGIGCMVGAVVEIPGMFLADGIARRFGVRKMLLFSLGLMGILRMAMFISPSVWMIIGARALVGIAYSFTVVTQVISINAELEQKQAGPALALFTIFIPTMINIGLMPLFGSLFDHFGPRILYLVSLIGYFIALAVFGLTCPEKKLEGNVQT